jgi:hypothetical protein
MPTSSTERKATKHDAKPQASFPPPKRALLNVSPSSDLPPLVSASSHLLLDVLRDVVLDLAADVGRLASGVLDRAGDLLDLLRGVLDLAPDAFARLVHLIVNKGRSGADVVASRSGTHARASRRRRDDVAEVLVVRGGDFSKATRSDTVSHVDSNANKTGLAILTVVVERGGDETHRPTEQVAAPRVDVLVESLILLHLSRAAAGDVDLRRLVEGAETTESVVRRREGQAGRAERDRRTEVGVVEAGKSRQVAAEVLVVGETGRDASDDVEVVDDAPEDDAAVDR